MNRRKFLSRFAALAAAGFVLPESAKAAGYQIVIPAAGVVPAAPAVPAAPSARFWRLVTKDKALCNAPYSRYVIAEIKMLDASGANIVTQGQTIASVASYNSGISSKAFDGQASIAAGYYAELPFADGQWIGQDFGKPVTIEEFGAITTTQANYPLPNFDIQISSDGQTWTTVDSMPSLNLGSSWVMYKPSWSTL